MMYIAWLVFSLACPILPSAEHCAIHCRMGSKVAWVVVAWVVLQAWAVVWVVSRADAVTTTRFQLKLQL